MPHMVDEFVFAARPTAERPLLGQTVLVVEDSRVAGEAVRLMCLRSGARVRRADSLRAAGRHLTTYRPSVALVDLGLPDGSGLELIGELAQRRPRVPVLLAMSGAPEAEAAAMSAGADAFLAKPLMPLPLFQRTILTQLPAEQRPPLRPVAVEDQPAPDPLALRDDLALAADVLNAPSEGRNLPYVGGFLLGIGRCADDAELGDAALRLIRAEEESAEARQRAETLAAMVQDRLAQTRVAI